MRVQPVQPIDAFRFIPKNLPRFTVERAKMYEKESTLSTLNTLNSTSECFVYNNVGQLKRLT